MEFEGSMETTSIGSNNGDTSNSNDHDDLCGEIELNIAAILETMVPGLTSECCIYRVANCFHELNDAAYTPRVISIGPFHYGRREMQFMERQKERYLFQFIRRTKLSLKDLVTFAKELEESIRRSYAEPIEPRKEDFVKNILFDGTFIIEYFQKTYFGIDESDWVLYKPRLDQDITRDLILLENQLPFWFLEKLYNLAPFINQDDKELPFVELVLHYFSSFNERNILPKTTILHFTDLIRIFNLPSVPREYPTYNLSKRKYFSCSATDLHAAGVQFKVNESKCLFDIQFTLNGVLSFPHFEINDSTETIFRNLMALEQCHYPRCTYICDYIILMDALIDTFKDVEILVKKGCVSNRLGGHDGLATLFNKLGLEITYDERDSYFCKLIDNITEYYEKPWHNWKANLKQDYFGTPWKTSSTIAAAILLILTFIQTIKAF